MKSAEIKVLQELGKKLEEEELEKYGTECLFQISRNDENLTFSCSVCEKEFKIGNFQKKVQNIKFHILSRSHIGRIQDKVVKSGGKEVCDAMAIFEKFEEEFGKEVFICKGTSAYCRCCNVQINLVTGRGDPLYRGRCHVNRWYKDQYTYFKDTSQQLTVDTKLLLNDLKYGEDFGNPSWYPLPFINVKILEESDTTEFNGTYKHVNCSGKVSIREGYSCYMCKNIPNLPSFKKRILLRVQKTDETGNRNLEKVRYEYLTQPEQLDILRDKNEKLEKAKDTIFFLKRREIRQKAETPKLQRKVSRV
ncbi:unnamed protein product [Mytilus edulis]|uniref:Uncharacterized protein n=1 Tax=Mytilus edulis TaxID=6550 RepID=A0A8S3TXQ2_MYTED|nr:unnamed protein product [Mytilus edulis]